MGLFRSTIKKVVVVTAVIVGKQILSKVAAHLTEKALEKHRSKSSVAPRITEKLINPED
ncbi:MAG: hypothetical protein HOP04_06255 [Methylophilaceae bacterium]|nr:hypothetical protein [Methylophilaceae bacterium]